MIKCKGHKKTLVRVGGTFTNKVKGFTLIELLAVIIILAVLALILVPVITNIIETSKKESFKDSAYGLVETAKLYYSTKMSENMGKFTTTTFTVINGAMTSSNGDTLDFNGEVPVGDSWIKINDEGNIAMLITNGKYYASKSTDEVEVEVTETEDSALTREELTTKINELTAEIEKLKAADNDLKNEDNTLSSNIESINSNLDTTKTNVSNLTTSLATTNTNVTTNTAAITDMTRLDNANNIFLKNYPVGSIYISTSSTNPSSLYGGTWESYGQGRNLIGVGSGTDTNGTVQTFNVNQTGGEYTHTLTIAEMPNHTHGIHSDWDTSNGDPNVWTYKMIWGSSDGAGYWAIDGTGGNQPHNNVSPYIATYMWKRTA